MYYLVKVKLLIKKLTSFSKKHDIPFQELEPVESIPFHIRPLHYNIIPDALKEKPHRHNFQELIWIKDGEGEHNIDNIILKIRPNMFYQIARGQVHYFLQGIGLKGYLIRFTDDLFFSKTHNIGWDYHKTLFNIFTAHQSLKIDKAEVAYFEGIMDTMLYEFNNKAYGWVHLLRHLLSILFIQLERVGSKKLKNSHNLTASHSIHNAFINDLIQEYKKHHTASYYAQKLCISERQLSDIVRRFSGKPVKRFIRDWLVLEAKRYLQNTNISIKELTYTLGFSDPSYFSKVFRQIVGQSPNSFRH